LTFQQGQDNFLPSLTRRLRGAHLDSASSTQVTELLARWSEGDAAARETLIPIVYNELRRLAGRVLAGQHSQTLQSTALVHEVYLRLVGQASLRAESRAHFLAIAARLMREILVDRARMHGAARHGANCLTLSFDETVALPKRREIDLVALDDALNALGALDPRQSQIVDLRFFGGLSIEDAAHVLGISPATVKREWATARVWLQHELRRSELA
jgi:RNA polymerase sigma factor (TIGR02999 family)